MTNIEKSTSHEKTGSEYISMRKSFYSLQVNVTREHYCWSVLAGWVGGVVQWSQHSKMFGCATV